MLGKLFYLLCFVGCACLQVSGQQTVTGARGERFTVCTVASGLSDPWEITYGPDHFLWVTEARGYRVSRINPETGEKQLLLDLDTVKNFPRYDLLPEAESGNKPWPQSGLMGLALHPGLLNGMPYVYIAYLYAFTGAYKPGNGCLPAAGGCFFTTRIARYTYDTLHRQLVAPVLLCDTIPGSNDHNAGRLLIAPVQDKLYLFYTVGDMGAGQYDNGARTNHAQRIDVYEGKVLRFNTMPDQDIETYDRWIPNDNPFNNVKQNAVWSYGHRNTQGLSYAVIGDTGRIYAAEHGPFSDDEINIIEKGKNYGHPLVIGYNDNNYNGLAAGTAADSTLPGKWHTSYPLILNEQANAAAIGIEQYRNPIISLYPVTNDSLTRLFLSLQQQDTAKPDWPSEAPSGIEVYTGIAIPGWQNSLLAATLKGGKLLRLPLNKTGNQVTGEVIPYFKSTARYRDLAVSQDGTTLYLATDSSTVSSGPSRNRLPVAEQRGTILAFRFTGMQPVTLPARLQGTRQKRYAKKAAHSPDATPAR
jgi:PQQ-dependent dehydrogenase (s-GDH family)